jgi:hypothetical protein
MVAISAVRGRAADDDTDEELERAGFELPPAEFPSFELKRSRPDGEVSSG